MLKNNLTPKFIVDGKEVDPKLIRFHNQIVPRPGGFNYRIEVSIENKGVISFLEKMVGCTTDNKKFVNLLGKSDSSAFNSVNWVLNSMNLTPGKIEWVFNTIDHAEINSDVLIIAGRCSKYLENFDNSK